MELLGVAEERKVFSADNMAAVMHWPAKYSVEVADWVTESAAAFSRFPASFCGHGGPPHSWAPPRNSPEHITEPHSRELLPPSPPSRQVFAEDKDGLFSQLLLSRRKHQRAPPAAPPEGPASAGHEQARQYHNNKCVDPNRQPCRRIVSASALAEAIKRHRYGRRFPPSQSPCGHHGGVQEAEARDAPVYGSFRRGNSAGASPPRANALKGSWGARGVSGSQGYLRRGRSPGRRVSDEEAAGCNEPQGVFSYQQELGGPASGGGDAVGVVPACQQAVQRQKDLLQRQYEQVEKLKEQLEELDEILSALQLQTSGQSKPQGGLSELPRMPKRNAGNNDLRISCSQPPEDDEEDEGYLGKSLDPRDYQNMSANCLDWIPPAGMPSCPFRA